MLKLNKKITVLFLALMSSIPLHGQKANDYSMDHKGEYSFRVSVDEDFRFRNFEGAGLLLQYNISNMTALRLSFTPSFSHSNAERDYESVTRNTIDKRSNFRVGFTYVRRLRCKKQTSLYVGLGPVFGYGNYSREAHYDDAFQIREEPYYSLGIRGIMGAELYLRHNISITLESGLEYSASFKEYKARTESDSQMLQDSKIHRIYSVPFTIGFAIYI